MPDNCTTQPPDTSIFKSVASTVARRCVPLPASMSRQCPDRVSARSTSARSISILSSAWWYMSTVAMPAFRRPLRPLTVSVPLPSTSIVGRTAVSGQLRVAYGAWSSAMRCSVALTGASMSTDVNAVVHIFSLVRASPPATDVCCADIAVVSSRPTRPDRVRFILCNVSVDQDSKKKRDRKIVGPAASRRHVPPAAVTARS